MYIYIRIHTYIYTYTHNFTAMVTGLVKKSNTTLCEMLERSDYEHIVWTAAAEFPGESVKMNDGYWVSIGTYVPAADHHTYLRPGYFGVRLILNFKI